MISAEEAIAIHEILIRKFGGKNGVRDLNLLESALARPFATFDGKDLYADSISKAAALLESVLINHPFVDGNKRTAYVLMRSFLLENSLDISATQNEKYDFIISICNGEIKHEEIAAWLKQKVK